jgi:hypothetical protein
MKDVHLRCRGFRRHKLIAGKRCDSWEAKSSLCDTEAFGDEAGEGPRAGHSGTEVGTVRTAVVQIVHSRHDVAGTVRRVRVQPLLKQGFDL